MMTHFLWGVFVCSGLEVYPSLEQKKLKTTSSTCLHPPVMGSSKCSPLFWREMRSVLVEEFCILNLHQLRIY